MLACAEHVLAFTLGAGVNPKAFHNLKQAREGEVIVYKCPHLGEKTINVRKWWLIIVILSVARRKGYDRERGIWYLPKFSFLWVMFPRVIIIADSVTSIFCTMCRLGVVYIPVIPELRRAPM